MENSLLNVNELISEIEKKYGNICGWEPAISTVIEFISGKACKKAITHFDEIKSMSIEEFVRLFMGYSCPPVDGDCPYLEQEVYRDDRDCGRCWLDWLNQEVSDEK